MLKVKIEEIKTDCVGEGSYESGKAWAGIT